MTEKAYMHGFSLGEERMIMNLVKENAGIFKERCMNTSNNRYDSLEQLIFDEGIRIQTIDIHPELDLLLVLLNTGGVLRESISKFERLKNA